VSARGALAAGGCALTKLHGFSSLGDDEDVSFPPPPSALSRAPPLVRLFVCYRSAKWISIFFIFAEGLINASFA